MESIQSTLSRAGTGSADGIKPAQTLGVMHVVDSLDSGGTETMAVNFVNQMPRDRYRPYICSTRRPARGAALAALLSDSVRHLGLDRTSRLDLQAIFRLRQFISKEDIRILHVHSTSLFIGQLTALFSPKVRVIWHDHYGRCQLNDRSARLYRMATRGVAGVIAVNRQLAEWACHDLHLPGERVWYIPNFVSSRAAWANPLQELPGSPGSRIVCVANLRPQKDHGTLLRAMASVRKKHAGAHLLLVGAFIDAEYAAGLRRLVSELGIESSVSFLGERDDVAAILRMSDIGVLSSISEGLPLSLLEYGGAGLPAVATSVGQCPDVLNHGMAGTLVEPSSPDEFANAINQLLDAPERRVEQGRKLQDFVRRTFDPAVIMNQICDIYDRVLQERP